VEHNTADARRLRYPLIACRFQLRTATLTFEATLKPILQHPIVQQAAHLIREQDPRIVGGVAGVMLLAAGGAWWWVSSHRPSAEEIERCRREELALGGRITDGVILDARTLGNEDSVSPTPEVLVYSYSLAGLVYNCAQDVSTLPNEVVGFRLDQPVQVRYDPRNPGNSIIVSETWTGLWLHSDPTSRK
jgi:Protein of unknown function (DUF3592)